MKLNEIMKITRGKIESNVYIWNILKLKLHFITNNILQSVYLWKTCAAGRKSRGESQRTAANRPGPPPGAAVPTASSLWLSSREITISEAHLQAVTAK